MSSWFLQPSSLAGVVSCIGALYFTELELMISMIPGAEVIQGAYEMLYFTELESMISMIPGAETIQGAYEMVQLTELESMVHDPRGRGHLRRLRDAPFH